MPAITIQGHKFEVPDAIIGKYDIGYALQTEGEVHALRQTMLENLRNNFAVKVKKEMNGAESLTNDQLNKLTGEFNEYAQAYEFGIRQAGSVRVVRDPLEREVRKLAKADISERYKAKHGQAIDKDQLEAVLDTVIERHHDEYVKRARAILRSKQAGGDLNLEELGLA